MPDTTCPICGEGALTQKTGTYETQFQDRSGAVLPLYVPDVSWLECENCGEAILDPAAAERVDQARRQALGLLSPNEIRSFRQELGKTQVEMSRLLGVGEKTYCRWESGAFVQSLAFDRYLRLLIANQENVQRLEMMEEGSVGLDLMGAAEQDEIEFPELQRTDALLDAADVFTRKLILGELHFATREAA